MPLISIIEDDDSSTSPTGSAISPASTLNPGISEPPHANNNSELQSLISALITLPTPDDTTDIAKLEGLLTETLRGVEGILALVNTYDDVGGKKQIDLDALIVEHLWECFAVVGRPPGSLFGVVRASDEAEAKRRMNDVDVSKKRLISLYHNLTHQLLLLTGILSPVYPPSASIITLLATFADSSKPWTTSETYSISQILLADIPNLDSAIHHILLTTIKPVFAPFTHQTATARNLAPSLSRASMPPSFPRKAPDPKLTTAETPIPWIHNRPEIITLLCYILSTLACSNNPNQQLAQLTPLILPPLLILLDYPPAATDTKPDALGLLRKFIHGLPMEHLLPPPKGRGLGDVIWEAVFPYLHWLPPLTPVNESVKILRETYLTLIALVDSMYPSTTKLSERERGRKLDKIVREGAKGAVGYCGEMVEVMGIILRALEPELQQADSELGLVRAMGIGSVKHLEFLMPWLCGILSNPFSALQPAVLVHGAVRVLRALLVQGGGWVRIRHSDPGEGDINGDGDIAMDTNEEETQGAGEGWQWEILGGCVDAWGALNHEIDSLNQSSKQRNTIPINEEREREKGRKLIEISQAMDALVGLVGVLEGVCVYTDPKTGVLLGREEWESVVRGVLEAADEVYRDNEDDEEGVRQMNRRRETRRLLGATIEEGQKGKEYEKRGRRELRELFGR